MKICSLPYFKLLKTQFDVMKSRTTVWWTIILNFELVILELCAEHQLLLIILFGRLFAFTFAVQLINRNRIINFDIKRKSEHTDRCCCPFKKRSENGHVGKKLSKVTPLQSQFLPHVSKNDRICRDCRVLFYKKFKKNVSPNIGNQIFLNK